MMRLHALAGLISLAEEDDDDEDIAQVDEYPIDRPLSIA